MALRTALSNAILTNGTAFDIVERGAFIYPPNFSAAARNSNSVDVAPGSW
jgi:hypothetical protein